MNRVVFVLVLCVCHVSQAWWSSSSSTTIDKRIMTCYCSTVCGQGATCSYNCNNSCGGKKRRRRFPDNAFTVLLPCKFEAWDLNKDGVLDVEEFAFTGHAKAEDRSTTDLFNRIDIDDDGALTRRELNSAPLLRERC